MALLSRLLAPLADLRSAVTGRLTLALGETAILSVALLLAAAPARAIVTPGTVAVEGQIQKYGIEPHRTLAETFILNPEFFNPLSVMEYGGGHVMHSNATYAIYWDPAKLRAGDPGRPGKYHGDWQQLINQFLNDVGVESAARPYGARDNVFALTPQYTESGGARPAYRSTFRGGYADHEAYPANGCEQPAPSLAAHGYFACLTDEQVRTELKRFIATNNLRTGAGTIFSFSLLRV